MPSPLPPPSAPHVAAWRSAAPRLAPRFVLGIALLASGLALSGQPLDRQWCLDLQQALSGCPTAWSLLTWSALGISSLLWVACLSDDEPRRVAGLLVAMVLGGLAVHAIKRTLQVDRPLAVFGPDHPLFHVIGEPLRKGSMPSGHTATAWTVAGLMTLSQARASVWRHGWWLLAALQGLSRVAVGAHWPSDVLAGAGVGLMLAPLVWSMGLTHGLGRWLQRPSVRPWVGGLLPVLALLLCLLDLGSPLPAWWCLAVLLLGLHGALRWSRAAPSGPSHPF